MSFPKYYVTYCVMDTDAGANPFGHSSLIFSQQESEHSPVKVMDGIGFYSQPNTTTNPVIKLIKKTIGLNVDLQDGHGILKQETIRNLDGNGLSGMSFEVTPEQFTALNTSYQNMMLTEAAVIEELNRELTAQGIKPNGYTRFIAEKEKAQREGRPPRLKPFHITMKLTMQGLDSSDSYTCKDHSLELLSLHHIIPEDIRNKLLSNRATTAFPIFSALALPPIRLISTGEPEKIISRSGAVFYNRVWGKNSLFWATPVHTVKLSQEVEDIDINKNYVLLSNMLNRIHNVERSLYDRISAIEEDQDDDQALVKRLKIQINRVQNLVCLFNNCHENQIPEVLEAKLSEADKILNIATMSMEPERINYPFLLNAFESTLLYDVCLGLLSIAIATATLFFSPPVGAALLSAVTPYTGRQMYGFYKEMSKIDSLRDDYINSINQTPDEESVLVATI